MKIFLTLLVGVVLIGISLVNIAPYVPLVNKLTGGILIATTLLYLGKNRKTIYLPKGMGNAFCVLGDNPVDYMYLITSYFEGAPTPAVAWNDPVLTRQFGGWPVKSPLVSEKDMHYPTLKEKYGEKVDFSKYPWLK